LNGTLEVFTVFRKLAYFFGGPTTHIGMFQQEVVQRHKGATDKQLLYLPGMTDLIPGSNFTEMTIHLGLMRAGRLGLITSGLAFTLPVVLTILTLALTLEKHYKQLCGRLQYQASPGWH
jgi:chromate transporter